MEDREMENFTGDSLEANAGERDFAGLR
ncbi:uncharacterized protein G2W53_010996 [Senna tora]|uniref:Uncharacterized protein n=1 Tax=Senna tora TaxID=362788 RepID=A0A834X0Q3_9FABA|nr:uncharacterized protein G2W53_010996 [Senna tora]